MSFKARLICFALFLALVAALPSSIVVARQPWTKLESLIKNGNLVLSTYYSLSKKSELKRMNDFALEMAEKITPLVPATPSAYKKDNINYYPKDVVSQSFNWILLHDNIPSNEELNRRFIDRGYKTEAYNYELFLRWVNFWEEEFKQRPGIKVLLKKQKLNLIDILQSAKAGGYDAQSIYIVLDMPNDEREFFKENVVFVIGSEPWWKTVHPGELYNMVETGTESWRTSYDPAQGGKPGFHHNMLFDEKNWYLPEFDRDEWGNWFTIWYTPDPAISANIQQYTSFNIDFDADTITSLMKKIALHFAIVLAVVIAIVVLFSQIIASKLAKPIRDITAGAEAVMNKEFEHTVPASKQGEFSRLIEVFNQMITWVKETTNLKTTLTKLLSKELAEKAAESGLDLGGQSANCTIMFTDFSKFSSITQTMSAHGIVNKLNFYFAEMIPIIKKWGGFPDKYIGDAIVVIFGAPVPFHNHAERAVKCAIEMQEKMREINSKLKSNGEVCFEMRIGINTGDVVVGAIGCDQKLEYTSIGETTNLANRMESKSEVGHALVSESTYRALDSKNKSLFEKFAEPISVSVKGYQNDVIAYPINLD